VFVRNQHRIDAVRILADRFQPSGNLFPAQTNVEE
jgi:hypothetical protein